MARALGTMLRLRRPDVCSFCCLLQSVHTRKPFRLVGSARETQGPHQSNTESNPPGRTLCLRLKALDRWFGLQQVGCGVRQIGDWPIPMHHSCSAATAPCT